MKTTLKKVLSMALALVLLLGTLPMAAFAAECNGTVQTDVWVHKNGNHYNPCDDPNCTSTHGTWTPCFGGTATCESGAICQICGVEYTAPDAANHTGGTEVRDAVAATCKAAGYTGDTYCLGCGEKIADGAATDKSTTHGATEVRGVVEATCKTPGYTGDTYCTVCGEKTADGTATDKSTTHGATEVRNAVEATCKDKGYTGDTYCTVCGEKTATGEDIPATGNHDTEVRGAVAATCKTPGYTGDTFCKDCGTKTATGEDIPATGEHDTEIRGKVAATCSTEGYTGDTFCKDCGTKTKKGEVIPATGKHDTEVRGKVEATADKDGYTGDTYCKDCGKKIKEGKVIKATGETAKKYSITFDPNYHNAEKTTVKAVEGAKIYDLISPWRSAAYTFAGWYKDIELTIPVDKDATVTKNATYYAKWTQNYPHEVYAKVYINGDTSSVFKYIDLHDYSQDGMITLKEMKEVAYAHIESNTPDGILKVYGPFDASQWEKYCLDDYYRNPSDKVFVNTNDKTVVYVMVHNAKIAGTTSGNKGTAADPSNPKTGDAIYAPAAVLGLSVSTLAVLFYLNKKRAF